MILYVRDEDGKLHPIPAIVGAPGKPGADGKTPVAGVDYFTADDKAEMVAVVLDALAGNVIPGYIDEDNNIVISTLTAGSYTIQYINEDGSTVDIAALEAGDTGPAYTNQIPISTEADGTPFNGGQGWKTGCRLNSAGAEDAGSSYANTEVVGFIPFTINDTIYIKGISTSTNHYLIVYDSSHTRVYGWGLANFATLDGSLVSFDIKSKANDVLTADKQASIMYMRLAADQIDDDSIITINEPIE